MRAAGRLLARLAPLARATLLLVAAAASAGSLWGADEGTEATPIYEACTTTAECVRAAEECVHPTNPANGFVTALGICTMACELDSECPDGGRCNELADGRKVCVATCNLGCPPELPCWNGMCHPPWQ